MSFVFSSFSLTRVSHIPSIRSPLGCEPFSGHASKHESHVTVRTTLTTDFLPQRKRYPCCEQLKQPFLFE